MSLAQVESVLKITCLFTCTVLFIFSCAVHIRMTLTFSCWSIITHSPLQPGVPVLTSIKFLAKFCNLFLLVCISLWEIVLFQALKHILETNSEMKTCSIFNEIALHQESRFLTGEIATILNSIAKLCKD